MNYVRGGEGRALGSKGIFPVFVGMFSLLYIASVLGETAGFADTGGPSGRQPGAIFQLQGRERRTPFDGTPIC